MTPYSRTALGRVPYTYGIMVGRALLCRWLQSTSLIYKQTFHRPDQTQPNTADSPTRDSPKPDTGDSPDKDWRGLRGPDAQLNSWVVFNRRKGE